MANSRLKFYFSKVKQYKIKLCQSRLAGPTEQDLLYFRTWNEEECYENPGSCTPCQGDHDVSEERNDDDYLQIFDTNDNSYLIIVESRTGVDSPFTLSMNCDD